MTGKTFSARILILACVGALFLTGCASKYGEQKTHVEHYPDCYQPIADLRKSEHSVATSTATGAVLGGILGGVVGYLATGKASGAAVGAGLGAAAGGTAGYVKGKSDKEQSDAQRMAAYVERMDGDISGLDIATAAAKAARQCYERQFEVAVSEFKAKNITKDQFRARYTEINSGMEEASRILGDVAGSGDQVSRDYQAALDSEAKRLGVPKSEVEAMKRPNTPAPAPAKTTKVAKAKAAPKAPATQPVASNLPPEDAAQFQKLAQRNAAMEDSLSTAKEEQRLLNERVASNRRAAADLMT